MSSQKKYATYPSLKGRVIVISGGATGIGASMVEAFASQGAEVLFLDKEVAAADSLVRDLDVPARIKFYHCDLTDMDDLRETSRKILAAHPTIHGLINNAANDQRQPTMDITPEQWDASMAVNLRHQFFLTQALMPGLLAAASVVNMGSIAWAVPTPDLAPYAAAKSAVVGLTRALAHEFGPRGGMRVNSIMPGAIATERQRREVLTPEAGAAALARQALKRLLEPEEVARLALWLVADDSSGVTSQSIVVDAGWI